MQESIYTTVGLSHEDYKKKYNKAPFKIEHNLHNNPLLELSSVQDLVLRLPQKNVFIARVMWE